MWLNICSVGFLTATNNKNYNNPKLHYFITLMNVVAVIFVTVHHGCENNLKTLLLYYYHPKKLGDLLFEKIDKFQEVQQTTTFVYKRIPNTTLLKLILNE